MQRRREGMHRILVSNGLPPLPDLGDVQEGAVEMSFYALPAVRPTLYCRDNWSAQAEPHCLTSAGDPPKLISSSSYANAHDSSDSVSSPKP